MPNIKVRFFGLSELSREIGNNEFDFTFEGETFGDALRGLEDRFGQPFRQTILDDGGEVNPVIQVMKNEDEFLQRDNLGYHLSDGDELLFMFMIAGGCK